VLNDEMIHVLIAHGNQLVGAGLAAAFAGEKDFQVVQCRLSTTAPFPPWAVAVTDYETGMRLIEESRLRDRRVLILTDDSSEVSIRRAVEFGARGYMLLSSAVESVIGAVRVIYTGGTALDPLATAKIAASLASPSLTSREMEVLRLMMQGMRDKVIARTLNRSVDTARSHVKAILTKLDAAGRVEAVAVARRRGLLPDADAAPAQEPIAAHSVRAGRSCSSSAGRP